jgi:hypothetical protein
MRKYILCLLSVLLLGACKKTSNAPVNFSCYVNGAQLQGNAKTLFNGSAFQILMNGPNGESTALTWYSMYTDSAIGRVSGTYTIPAIELPPAVLAGSFAAPYGQAVYYTGTGNNLGGTITITSNTGSGGTISGTYSFNALYQNGGFVDTVHITRGTFTNVPMTY